MAKITQGQLPAEGGAVFRHAVSIKPSVLLRSNAIVEILSLLAGVTNTTLKAAGIPATVAFTCGSFDFECQYMVGCTVTKLEETP